MRLDGVIGKVPSLPSIPPNSGFSAAASSDAGVRPLAMTASSSLRGGGATECTRPPPPLTGPFVGVPWPCPRCRSGAPHGSSPAASSYRLIVAAAADAAVGVLSYLGVGRTDVRCELESGGVLGRCGGFAASSSRAEANAVRAAADVDVARDGACASCGRMLGSLGIGRSTLSFKDDGDLVSCLRYWIPETMRDRAPINDCCGNDAACPPAYDNELRVRRVD